MSPVDAVRSGLRQYATFTGRARRSEYWWFVLFALCAQVVALLLDLAIIYATGFPVAVLTFVVGLGLLVPQLALVWRRLHDTGRSGAWYFIGLVPFGGIVLLVFSCLDSQPHPNQFGPSPKGGVGHGYGYGQPQQYGQTPQQY